MYNITFNTALIDSLTLFIELDKIEVLDYKLITPYKIFYEETAEFIDEINAPKQIISDVNGIKFRFLRVVWTHPVTKEQKEMIQITITSKMLREKYFQGITKENIIDVLNYINNQNVIKISLENFLAANVNDIDLCINYKLDFNSYVSALKMLNDMVKLSKKAIVELYPRNESQRINENVGLSYNKRENASIGSPFIKFYNKTYELLNNSAEFYNLYLFPQLKYGLDIKNIVRKEITIKNSKHKSSLIKKRIITSVENLTTLNDLFLLTQTELDTICNIQMKYYYEKKQFSISSDLSPTDKILSYYMNELVNLGMDKNLLMYPLNLIDCKVTKSRTKKKLDELIDLTFNDNYMSKKLEENSFANQFIKMQDIW